MSRLARNSAALVLVAIGAALLMPGLFNGSARAVEPDAATACAGQAWPAIDPACLVAADGSPVRQVRIVDTTDGTEAPAPLLIRLPQSH